MNPVQLAGIIFPAYQMLQASFLFASRILHDFIVFFSSCCLPTDLLNPTPFLGESVSKMQWLARSWGYLSKRVWFRSRACLESLRWDTTAITFPFLFQNSGKAKLCNIGLNIGHNTCFTKHVKEINCKIA